MLICVICRACSATVDDSARFCPACGMKLVADPARLQRGAQLVLGDWGVATLGDPLGEGGMGVVHRAWLDYLPTGRLAGTPSHPVAVKVLRAELRGSERARRMFQREAVALERLLHPNIVQFVGLVDQSGQLAIVMELVNGAPLAHLIYDASRLRALPRAPLMPAERIWHYFSQLLGALASVHSIGILHRDVKSANVLIRADGFVKLTDFGIARLPEGSPRATGGIVPGTGAYMSPEQVRGEELDARADLYSAAILLYEMTCGVTPFDSGQRDELMMRAAQIEEPPPALSQRVDGISPELDLVLARALAKDRRHRFASAIELGEAVRKALGQVPAGGWAAQLEFSAIARTISAAMPQQSDPQLAQRAERLRTAMMSPVR